MNKNYQLNLNQVVEPGATYLTDEGLVVTCIKPTGPFQGLFVSSDHSPTPFVIWDYLLYNNDNSISLSRGRYHATIEDALGDLEVVMQKSLAMSTWCPACEAGSEMDIPLYYDVEAIKNYVNSAMFCRCCGGKTGGAYKIRFDDSNTSFTLPLWKGPTT